MNLVLSSRGAIARLLTLGLAAAGVVAPLLTAPPATHANPAGTGLIISEVGMFSSVNEAYIELFNPTSSDVSLSGWSIQHSLLLGANDIQIDDSPAALVGSVPAGKTFLITDITQSGMAQFTPDYVYPGVIGFDAHHGTWILADTTTSLGRNGNLAGATNVVDAVGVGLKAPGYETQEVSPSSFQQVGRPTCPDDTNNNSADFTDGGTRTPTNSTGTDPICGQDRCDGMFPTIVASGSPVEGTEDDDVIIGTDGADTIHGNGGNDTICAFGGDDIVTGGEGNDQVFGGPGVDQLDGVSGTDHLKGGAGADEIYGGLTGAEGDEIFGGPGADFLSGAAGADFIYGGSEDDQINGGGGHDLLKGNLGVDLIDGGSGEELIFGGPGADDLNGSDDRDIIIGGAGADELNGNGGNDLLKGGDDDDFLYGNDGDDRLVGGAGGDTLDGGAGTNVLIQ